MSWVWQALGGGNGGGGAPPVPRGWTAFYDETFVGLPAQTMNVAASYAIGGALWWAKGPVLTGGTNYQSVALGLTLDYSAGVGAWAFTPTGDIAYRVLALPLAQFANYEPSCPLAIQGNFGITGGGPQSYFMVGYGEAAASAATWKTAERLPQTITGLLCNGAGDTAPGAYNNLSILESITPAAPVTSDSGFGIIRGGDGSSWGTNRPYAGSFANPSLLPDRTGRVWYIAPNATVSPCVLFLINTQVGQNFVCSLRRLRLSQPR